MQNIKNRIPLLMTIICVVGLTSCSKDGNTSDIPTNSSTTTNSTNTSNNNTSNTGNTGNTTGNTTGTTTGTTVTLLKFTVKVTNRVGGQTAVSNINVFIYKYQSDMTGSVGNYYAKNTTDYNGLTTFDNLPFTNGTIYYKVTGVVTQNGVTTLRESTGSIGVTKNTTANAYITF